MGTETEQNPIKPAPSVAAVPILEVGRLQGAWYVLAGDVTTSADTIGDVAGKVVNYLSALQPHLVMREIRAAKLTAQGESPEGAQAALVDAVTDIGDAAVNEQEPVVGVADDRKLDHFLATENGWTVVRRVKNATEAVSGPPTWAQILAGDRSEDFYLGMLTGLALTIKAKLYVAEQQKSLGAAEHAAAAVALNHVETFAGHFMAGVIALLDERGKSNGGVKGSTGGGPAQP